MPYIAKAEEGISLADSAALDTFITDLVNKMKKVNSDEELYKLEYPIGALARAINRLSINHGYPGAFAGFLNYSLHKIFLSMLPGMRYWVMALSTPWLKRAAHLFRSAPNRFVWQEYSNSRPPIPYGTPLAFKHVTEWSSINLAYKVAVEASYGRGAASIFWYDIFDLISGVFENIETEFYRRAGAAYEDKQIGKNGDLPEYAELLKKISAQ